MNQVFVCEKPSVARELATAISGGYKEETGYYKGNDGKLFTYAFGHLVSCVNPASLNLDWGWKGDVSKLPFFIKNIPLMVIENPGAKKQYKIIITLMKQSDIVYIATDAGREGEHIFRKIYSLSGVQKPLKRMWIQDMTKEGINKAFHDAKDGSLYEGLATAGRLREESDLLIGTNGTMLITKLSKSSNLLSLGRVQTPTLTMIVNRDKVIENFSKVIHYSIAATDKNGAKYELVLDKEAHLTKGAADAILKSLGDRTAFTIDVTTKQEKPEKLFDLTELQKFMNGKYTWKVNHTLNITQALYEKKYVTYPRTSSQYIANDSELPDLLEKHTNHDWVKKIISNGYKIEPSFVDPSKVTDHEAITITSKIAENLSKDEALLYDVIFTRFLAAFYPPAIKEETTAIFSDKEYTFKTKETVLIEPGWRTLYKEEIQEGVLKHTDLNSIGAYTLIQKETKPPKRYTDGTLLNDMKHAAKFSEETSDKKILKATEGIGTTATRADIIEKLITRGFIERKKNQLISTSLGRELIDMMPRNFSLYNVQLTALFETMLSQVEQGKLSEEVFYEKLERLINITAQEIRSNVKELPRNAPSVKEPLAKCPNCQKPVYENKKAYSCSGCHVTIWKNALDRLGKKNVTSNEAKKLLSGKTIKVTLKSRKGNPFKVDMVFNPEKSRIEFTSK